MHPACYALEGSIAVAGSLVQWLRDNLGLIRTSGEIETLAASVADNGDVYFVPAFSGLYAPWWRADARGVIAGLTRYATAGHIARAALEATAYQTLDVIEAMQRDSGIPISTLRVDGGMVVNELLMQFQADILNVPVLRPRTIETTALGAAYAAGLAVGYWDGTDDLRHATGASNAHGDARYDAGSARSADHSLWHKAIAIVRLGVTPSHPVIASSLRSQWRRSSKVRTTPSTGIAVPVTKSEAGLARNAAIPAMSPGTPQRAAGVRFSTRSCSPSTSRRARRVKSVSIHPGNTAFTWMLSLAHAVAIARAICIDAALARGAIRRGIRRAEQRHPIEPMLIIRLPPRLLFIGAYAACEHRKALVRLVSST